MILARRPGLIGLEIIEVEIAADSPLVGRAIRQIEGAGGFVIVAVKRPDGTMVRNPPMDFVLEARDSFVLLGHREALPVLTASARAEVKVAYRGSRA